MENRGENKAAKPRRAIRFSVVNAITVGVALVLALGLFLIARTIDAENAELRAATDQYIECEQAANNMNVASNYLTTQARMFVVTHDPQYLRNYLIEEADAQRRQHAIATLALYSRDEAAQRYLDGAMQASDGLGAKERYAMKLVVEAEEIPAERGAAELEEVYLSHRDRRLSAEEKIAKAESFLLGDEYQSSRDYIDRMIAQCESELVETTRESEGRIESELATLLLAQSLLAALLLAVVACATIFHVQLFIRPLKSYTAKVNAGEPLDLIGAAELQHLARAYNDVLEENERHRAHLVHEAEHDPLTDLLNRSAYDKLYEEHIDNQALLLVDIDYFKSINDDWGHEVGDAALKFVADSLRGVFRSTDYPCRIGGDEFAVIMTNMTPQLRHVVEQRIEDITQAIARRPDGLPPITLSIGVAFSEDADENTSIYKAADIALYAVKDAGRNGHAFYEDLPHPESNEM